MAEEEAPAGGYVVGYAKPPAEHRWKRGQSGNPKGRPKARELEANDITSLLNEPVKVKAGSGTCEMHPFEAGVRQLARRALDGNLNAIARFMALCEEYGAIAPPPAPQTSGVLVVPRGVDSAEWLQKYMEELPPPDEEDSQ